MTRVLLDCLILLAVLSAFPQHHGLLQRRGFWSWASNAWKTVTTDAQHVAEGVVHGAVSMIEAPVNVILHPIATAKGVIAFMEHPVESIHKAVTSVEAACTGDAFKCAGNIAMGPAAWMSEARLSSINTQLGSNPHENQLQKFGDGALHAATGLIQGPANILIHPVAAANSVVGFAEHPIKSIENTANRMIKSCDKDPAGCAGNIALNVAVIAATAGLAAGADAGALGAEGVAAAGARGMDGAAGAAGAAPKAAAGAKVPGAAPDVPPPAPDVPPPAPDVPPPAPDVPPPAPDVPPPAPDAPAPGAKAPDGPPITKEEAFTVLQEVPVTEADAFKIFGMSPTVEQLAKWNPAVDGVKLNVAYKKLFMQVHPDRNPGMTAKATQASQNLSHAKVLLEEFWPSAGAAPKAAAGAAPEAAAGAAPKAAAGEAPKAAAGAAPEAAAGAAPKVRTSKEKATIILLQKVPVTEADGFKIFGMRPTAKQLAKWNPAVDGIKLEAAYTKLFNLLLFPDKNLGSGAELDQAWLNVVQARVLLKDFWLKDFGP